MFTLKHSIKWLLCSVFLMMLPLQATAATKANDWTLSTSLSSSDKDTATSINFNIARCRELFAISTQELTLVLSLKSGALPGSKAEFAVKYARNHEKCDKSSLEQADDSCELISAKRSLTLATSPFEIIRSVSSLSSATSAEACESLQESSYLYLIVNEPTTTGSNNIYTVTYTFDFRSSRPVAPTGLSATAGESSIKVNWTAVDDTALYNVYYCPEGSTMTVGQAPETLSGCKSITSAKNSASIKSNLKANTNYFVGVVSTDKSGNESLLAEVVTVSTKNSDDFWESYKKENQDTEGGFCFIATAAWGSTQEPHVAVLRKFRDQRLMNTSLGRAFVQRYYELSPPLALYIQHHPTARSITRTLLWPVFGVAILSLYAPQGTALALFLILGLLVCLFVYRRGRRFKSATASAAILLALIFMGVAPSNASADESPVDMMFEFKAGPYTPDQLGAAFDKHFEGKTGYLIEAEYDYQFYRDIGSLGAGLHLGYGSVSGKAIDESGTESVDETSISWLPIRLSLVYRMDWLWLNLNIPLTVYGKIGFDYVVWWVSDGSGSIAEAGGESGSGGTFGWHGVVGVAFVLDWISPGMAKSFDVEWGVNNSYIFAEFVYADISNFRTNKGLNLTDSATFLVGLAIEF